MAKVKCLICGETFDKDKEQSFKVSNRYVHNKCLQETEHGHLLQLEYYIKTIMGIDKISVLIKKQISKYYEKGWSYKSIALTLKYFYEVKHGDPSKAVGIGIVEYVYDEAKAYYTQMQKVLNNIENIDKVEDSVRVITINPPLRKNKRRKIDLTQIKGD